MKVVATYNLKGGVGKTATAVNLAYLSAEAGLRTLLWDLDPQGAASYYLRTRPRKSLRGKSLIEHKKNFSRAIRETDYPALDLVPADFSMRNLDLDLVDQERSTKRLRALLRTVREDYDIVFVDCAPTMSRVSENVFTMANVLLVPLIPTHLSLRAYDQLEKFRETCGVKSGALVPFFSMVDRRKRMHKTLIAEFAASHPEVLRSYIPYASSVERMGEHRAPVNVFANNSTGGRAFRSLFEAFSERLKLGA